MASVRGLGVGVDDDGEDGLVGVVHVVRVGPEVMGGTFRERNWG